MTNWMGTIEYQGEKISQLVRILFNTGLKNRPNKTRPRWAGCCKSKARNKSAKPGDASGGGNITQLGKDLLQIVKSLF